MKTALFGIIVLCTIMLVPAYADCGGDGYEPFRLAAQEAREAKEMQENTFVVFDD